MGWTDAIRYVKGGAAKHGVGSLGNTPRVDDGLPLGARIGGILKMQIAPFIRATTAGSLIAMPGDADTIIKAVGHVKLNFPGNIYRYYLATGDDDSEKEKFLQVVQDARGIIVELMYCTRLTRIIPETEEDQNAFTGEGGVGLGQRVYTLWREQVAESGYTELELIAAMGDTDSLDYVRETGSPDQEFVPPFSGEETRVDDASGTHGLSQDIWFVPYVRQIGENKEYLLITTEIVNSKDGDASQRSIHVDFMIGIPLEVERVTIQ